MIERVDANVCNYPDEIFSALTQKKTFAVTSKMFATDANRGERPLAVYQEPFSRFTFAIIDATTNQRRIVTANIRVDEMQGILDMSQSARVADLFLSLPSFKQIFTGFKSVEEKLSTNFEKTKTMIENTQLGLHTILHYLRTKEVKRFARPKENAEKTNPNLGKLANSVTISTGKLKGMTPYQVICKENGKEDLLAQRKWLMDHLASYPKNQTQIDAIDDAIAMEEANLLGKEVATNTTSLGSVLMYSSGPRPNIHKSDENGFSEVKEVVIYWHLAEKYPVEIVIENYKAPVIRKDQGSINVEKAKRTELLKSSFRMSSTQWSHLCHMIQVQESRFEMQMAGLQLAQATNALKANRLAAGLPEERE